MRKEKFQLLEEQQQFEFLKQIVEERHVGYEADLNFSLYKRIDDFNDTSLSLSWEEPLGRFDETDFNFYQGHFGNIVESVLFNVLAYVNAKNEPALCVHYFLFY